MKNKCKHTNTKNIKSEQLGDQSLVTERCDDCKYCRYVTKGKNYYSTSKWFLPKER